VSRARVFLVFLAFAGLAIVFAACGSSSGGGSDEEPQAVLKGATFEGIESADLELKVGVQVSGPKAGDVNIDVDGPFQTGGKGQLPELDMNAHVKGSVNGSDIDKEVGLALVPNKASVSYEGENYEVDPTTFSFIESAINQANSQGETPTETSTACQKAAAGLKISDFVENLTNEGGADVGGTETTKVSGDLDVPGAIAQILKLAENPACSSSLSQAGPLPLSQLEEAKGEVEKALKNAHVAVYVGEDKIVRRVTAEFSIEPQGASEKVDLEIDLALNGVNEEQEIEVPSGGKPLTALFQKLGVNPIELLQGIKSGGGLGLEGILNEAIGGAGGASVPGGGGKQGAQGAAEECAQQATSATALRECITSKLG
jgi:hypothetical protein